MADNIGSTETEIEVPSNESEGAVSLDQLTATVTMNGKKRTPRRVIHFSDGIVEEYSTDEEEETAREEPSKEPPVDPASLPWSKWMMHHMGSAASSTLSAADFCGEKLAWFFGITSPKYQYVLDEIQRRQLEEREEKEREQRENEAAEKRRTGQTFVDLELVDSSKPSSANGQSGYDNVVFRTDEEPQDLKKF